MNNELINFCMDVENAEKCYDLAEWYYNQNHYAPAFSFYLRASERSDNVDLIYTCLIKCSICSNLQGRRKYVDESVLLTAIQVNPKKPTAYYLLSDLYYKQKDYKNSYMYANFGLKCYDNLELDDVKDDQESIKHLMLYVSALSGWHWGKNDHCSNTMLKLKNHNECWDLFTDEQKKTIEEKIYEWKLIDSDDDNSIDINESNYINHGNNWRLLYEKAVSYQEQGKIQLARDFYKFLAQECWYKMDDFHKEAVRRKFTTMGVTSLSQSQVKYTINQYPSLRYKFNGSEKIGENYSQVLQDIFVLSALNGKRNGTFLEIGSSHPVYRNNTYLLETMYGWTGVAIEIDEDHCTNYASVRPNIKLLNTDAQKVDYEKVLDSNFDTEVIDYLQLDIEPSENTYNCLLKIPFDRYKFAVITYEHDYYLDIGGVSFRQASRDFLESKGYVLIVNDVSPEGVSTFEDWWVHPDLVDSKIIEMLYDVSPEVKNIKSYMLNS
tara:strand:+ start:80 stop:1558 length:1479 start_codon:yes stop_codon:yes gene_type:complete